MTFTRHKSNSPGRARENSSFEEDDALPGDAGTDNALGLAAVRDALNALSQGIGIFNGELRLSVYNDKFVQYLGLPPELAKAGPKFEDVARFVGGADTGAGNAKSATQGRLATVRQGHVTQYQHTKADGTVIDIRDTLLPGGEILTTCTDVTGHRLAEGSLAESEQHVHAILANAAEGIITIDESGIIKSFNPAAARLFGYEAREVMGKNVSLLMEGADAQAHGGHLRAYMETGQAKIMGLGTREVMARRKDGTSFPIELNVSEFFLSHERRFIGSIRDITERKETEQAIMESEANLKRQVVELRDREERLETQGMELVALAEDTALMRDELDLLNKQKDKFFSIIAHDLKSPFNALLGFSSILESRGSEMDKDQVAEYGHLVHQAAGQAYNLLEDLLDWSRLQMGRMEFEPEMIDLNKTFEAALFLFEPIAAAKGITLQAEHQPGLSAFADKKMVETILRNLINNAIKFTDKEGAVSLKAENSGGRVHVSVTDNGVGMAPGKLEKLFRIEEKTTTQGTGGETGTGLGLHLCKELVEKNGGEITIESAPGKGSTFRFSLPGEEPAKD